MNYEYKDGIIKYRQSESTGVSLLMTEGNHRLILNNTGVEILDYLPHYTNTNDVLKRMIKDYPLVDENVLKFDMDEILRIFEIYSVIEIKDTHIECNDNLEEYVIAGDTSYKKISEFIIRSIRSNAIKYYQETDELFYSPFNMRLRIMDNREYGVYVAVNNDIKAYLSVVCPPIGTSAVLIIGSLFFKEGLSQEEMLVFLPNMINRIARVINTYRKIFKIRIALIDERYPEIILDMFRRINFEHECTLKSETLLGDAQFYTYFLKDLIEQ
ncbi:MAG: hypothetical protein FWC13_09915 [Oscillospiraceae bacterium]|nr:hypothetical protein [Oscillospiraceae bacterium]